MKSKRLKKLISERARDCCEYCLSQAKYAPDPFSIEHIMPRSKGGSDDPDNLAWAVIRFQTKTRDFCANPVRKTNCEQ